MSFAVAFKPAADGFPESLDHIVPVPVLILAVAHVFIPAFETLLIQKGFDYFLAEIWIYPDGCSPAKEVFETMGRIVWQKRIDGFYSQFPRYGMSCPICGDNCVCGAWVEVMEL